MATKLIVKVAQIFVQIRLFLSQYLVILLAAQKIFEVSIVNVIENANNLVFWCRFLNKLEPWYAAYIMQQ